MDKIENFIKLVRDYYREEGFIPLHAPVFNGNELKYIEETIRTSVVSSVGRFVDDFESSLSHYVNCAGATAVVNGTAGLQTALKIVGVKPGDEVITQSLTFIATANSIRFNNAFPVFIDVDKDTFGLSPEKLEQFLKENTRISNKECFNINTGRRISCCLPMHTFGFLCRIEEIVDLCKKYNIKVVEDAAEALGTFKGSKSAGTFGDLGVFSFNGNKVITSGGGGAIVSNNPSLIKHAKHVTTTAKRAHPYEYFHDQVGFNFRMPNLNAALALAQLENIDQFIEKKAKLFDHYNLELEKLGIKLVIPPKTMTRWNHWLLSITSSKSLDRELFLEKTNINGVMTRPIWKLISDLPIYSDFESHELSNSRDIEASIINIPSSARI